MYFLLNLQGLTTAFSSLTICTQRTGLMTMLHQRLLLFLLENQRQTVALNMYYSVSTARWVFAMSLSLRRNF
jgi:hypothetical protein